MESTLGVIYKLNVGVAATLEELIGPFKPVTTSPVGAKGISTPETIL